MSFGIDVGGATGGKPVVKLDSAALARLLRSESGVVARATLAIGAVTRDYAKEEVGVKTGFLRDRIVTRMRVEGGQVHVFVGSDVPYAIWHHEGGQPHVIEGRPLLAFSVGGRLVVVRRVNHPGNKPNRFLLRALQRARSRFR